MLVLNIEKEKTKDIVVEFEGNKIPAQIYPNKLSDELTGKRMSDSQLIAELYSSIDVCLHEGDEKLVLTPDNTKLLPTRLIVAMVDAYRQAALEGKKPNTTS